MNVGLMFSFRNPPKWKQPWADVYATQLEQMRLAEELGYDSVWLTEHHFAEDGYSPSLLTIAGAVAASTRRVRIGTFLLLLPLHNAVEVAENAATVDVISRGRLDLGVGKGYARHEFLGYGIPRKDRASRFEEGIDVLRGIWTQDPFSFTGKHYDVKDVRLTPKPVQSPPPLWVGALGPKAVDRAARLGCHFLGIGDTTVFDDALRRYGRNPSDHHVAQLVWVHIGRSRDEAWDEAQEHVHWMLSVYGKWNEEAGDMPQAPPTFFKPPPAAELRRTTEPLLFSPIIGTTEDVARGLEEFLGKTRTTHLVLGMHLPGLDPKLTRRSMETFARELLPRFQKRT